MHRRRLGAFLGAELICAAFLVGGPQTVPAGPAVATPSRIVAAAAQPGAVGSAPVRTVAIPDGRTAQLIDLGAPGGASLLDRISTELPSATEAVTAFWGAGWPQHVTIVIAGSQQQFAVLAGGGPDVAATTTADGITFAPGAVAMNAADLRIVLRHELFHYAARLETAADVPMWLTEGVADFVGRPATGSPLTSVKLTPSAQLPTDAELSITGPGRSEAYDRAWMFASYVADAYGVEKLRTLYLEVGGQGHLDVASGVRNALGVELPVVLAGWRHWGSR